MYYLRLLGLLFSRLLEYVRGARTVTEITEIRSRLESLVAYASTDYTVTIHCKERKFKCDYTRWWIPNKIVTTYEVFATLAGRAPPALIEACADDRTFPKLLHNWSSRRHQKEAAIEAFVDLIQAHIVSLGNPPRLS
jgi:hypothetical protein